MAKAKTKVNESRFKAKPRIKRPGIHAKTKTSYSKVSRNYKKLYKGQGR